MLELTKDYSVKSLGTNYDVITSENHTFVCNKGFIQRGTTLLFIPQGYTIGRNRLLDLLKGENYMYSLKKRTVMSREIIPGIVSNSIVVKWSHLKSYFFRNITLADIYPLGVLWEINNMLDWSHFFPISGFQELIKQKYTSAKKRNVPRNSSKQFTIQFEIYGEYEPTCYIGKRLYRGYAVKRSNSWIHKILNFFRLTKEYNKYYPTLSKEGLMAMESMDVLKNIIPITPLGRGLYILTIALSGSAVTIDMGQNIPPAHFKRIILKTLDTLLLNKTNY